MYVVLYFADGGWFRADSVSEIINTIGDFDSPIVSVELKNESGEEFTVLVK